MNILLINPWITDFAAFDLWDRPLGLLYVGAFMEARGHSVRLVDCMDRFQDGRGHKLNAHSGKHSTGKFHREIIEKPACFSHVPRYFTRYGIPVDLFKELLVDCPKPDAILVTSIMTYWYPGAFQAIELAREAYPEAPIFLGGIYATLCTEHAKAESGADYVIAKSSPEKIITAVEERTGIKGDGDIPSTQFGNWPEPLWGHYDNLPHAVVMTARGCPMRCTVCASRQLFDGFERRSPESAVASILSLAERGVRDIAFADDALLINADNYAAPMFEKLASHGAPVRLHTPNGLHVREITSEIAVLMKRAGVVTVRLSLESSSDERASDFSSKVSLEDFRLGAARIYDAGFAKKDVGAYILAGLPGQTLDEVIASAEFARSCSVAVKPALFSPVPGTSEFDKAVSAGMIAQDDDPLLQNNTLRTIDWLENGSDGYNEFRKLLTTQNREILQADEA